MATLTAGPNGLDMRSPAFAGFSDVVAVFQADASFIDVFLANGHEERISGSFQYDANGNLVGGSINELQDLTGGTLFFDIAGLTLPVSQFNAFANANDANGLLAFVFSGHDTFIGGPGNDVLIAFGPNNTFIANGGFNFYNGGSGTSGLVYSSAPGAVTINLVNGTALNGFGGADTFVNFRSFIGSNFNDTFYGGPGSNIMDGGAGINTLSYIAAPDQVVVNLDALGSADSGAALNGFGGTDFFRNMQIIAGSNFDDFFIAGPGNHTLDGGAGVNTIDYELSSTGVTVNLAKGTETGATFGGISSTDGLAHFQAVIGSSQGNNTFTTGPGSDTFDGHSSTGNTVNFSSTALNYSEEAFGSIVSVVGNGTPSETVDLLARVQTAHFTTTTDPIPAGQSPTTVMQLGGSFVAGQAQFADVNGDGKADLIVQSNDNGFYAMLSTGTGFAPPQLWEQLGGSFVAGQAQYADVNGDGKADLIVQSNDNGFYVMLSNGTGFALPHLAIQLGGSFVAGQAQYANVSGHLNGEQDLIVQSNDNGFYVMTSNGSNGFNLPQLGVQLGGSFVAGQAHYADVNGDGRADLIVQSNDDGFYVMTSNGTGGFNAPAKWLQLNGSFVAGQAQFVDVNGDGKADLLFQDSFNHLWLATSNGAGFNNPQLVASLPGTFQAGDLHFADVNGDGHPDLIFQDALNNFYVGLWNGSGFTAPTLAVAQGGSFAAGDAHLANVTGTGLSSLVFQDPNNTFQATNPTPIHLA